MPSVSSLPPPHFQYSATNNGPSPPHINIPTPARMAAAAAVGSCFSAVVTPCIQSKKHAKCGIFRMPNVSYSSVEHFSIGGAVTQKWWLPRTSAAVEQEELAAAEEIGEEVGGGEEVEGGEEGVVTVAQTTANTKLYFGNLPYNCDSSLLAGIIQEYASPEMVEVLYDRDTGRSRGFAFVTMSSVEDCEAIIQNLDGSQYGGRTLRVNFSDKPKPKEPLYPESEHKIFVGNLSWSVTSESLTQVFQEYGNVVGARVLYDGDTGRSRGYGFVCYSTKTEMETALESLNGVELEGRAMRISLALGKRS